MRLEAESAAIREAYPEAYVDLAVFVTDLGGSTGLVLVLALVYWLCRGRDRAALVAGYTVVGVATILLLKHGFAMPRPPAEVRAIPLADDPYGFPSGHAFMAVVVYGGLAVAYDRLDDPLTVPATGAVIVAISLSRVVLGLHYLADVVVGAALGLVALAALHVLLADDPRRGFALGAVLALPAIVASGGEPYALVGLGASLGGLAASVRLDAVPDLRSRVEGVAVAAVGLCFLIAVSALESAFAAGVPAGIVLSNAVLVAGILLAPAVVDEVRARRPRLRRESRP